MNIYELEVCAIGTYTAVNPYDHSGCSDRQFDCWQEAVLTVAAESIEDAVKMIYEQYERLNRDYSNSCDTLYYTPVPLSVKEDEGDKPEILDYHFCEPKDGDGATDAPERYSVEVE